MATYTADLQALAKEITVTVKIPRMREWGWRLKIGAWLIQLAGWIMWMNIEIEEAS